MKGYNIAVKVVRQTSNIELQTPNISPIHKHHDSHQQYTSQESDSIGSQIQQGALAPGKPELYGLNHKPIPEKEQSGFGKGIAVRQPKEGKENEETGHVIDLVRIALGQRGIFHR